MIILADVSITVIDKTSPIMRKLARSLKDFRQPLATMSLVLDKSFKRQFIVSGIPKWRPLAPVTIFYRRNHSDKPLIDTGRLMRSYVSRTSDSIYQLSTTKLVVGSNVKYARLHQYGGKTTMQEKRWFKKTGKGEIEVSQPKLTKSGKVSSAYKVKNINSFISIDVPARPLTVLLEDIADMKLVMERWLMRQARK